MKEKLSICRVVKLEGKRPLGRPRNRWMTNIGMDLKCGLEGVDLIVVTQNRDEWLSVMSTVIKS